MPNIPVWLGIILSGIVAILSFFGHINSLDSRQRAELGALQARIYARSTEIDDRASRRYAEIISKISENSARIQAGERELSKMVDLIAQDILQIREQQRAPVYESGEKRE